MLKNSHECVVEPNVSKCSGISEMSRVIIRRTDQQESGLHERQHCLQDTLVTSDTLTVVDDQIIWKCKMWIPWTKKKNYTLYR